MPGWNVSPTQTRILPCCPAWFCGISGLNWQKKTATPAGVRPFRRALREAWQGLAASGVPSRDHLPDTRRWGQIVEALAAGQEPPSPFSQSPPLHLSRLPKAVSLSFRPGSSPPRVLPFPEKGLPPFR